MSIPVVFLFSGDAKILLSALEADPKLKVTLQNSVGKSSFKVEIYFVDKIFLILKYVDFAFI